jgi:hypothetical protein
VQQLTFTPAISRYKEVILRNKTKRKEIKKARTRRG